MSSLPVVAGIIENGQGEVLLAERPAGKHLAGFWEFPGGKIEKSEMPETALQRELKEELELDVRILESLGAFSHTYEFGEIVLHVFRVLALNAPRKTGDIANFRWMQPTNIELTELAPADHAPLRAYLSTRP